MTDSQIAIVQSTWKQVSEDADQLASDFYSRLLKKSPDLRALFKGDMGEQGRKLVTMISVAVQGLNELDKLKQAIQQLGRRHKGYGVQKGHYQEVGEALLGSLENLLGRAFTEEVRQAWTAFYNRVADTMQSQPA